MNGAFRLIGGVLRRKRGQGERCSRYGQSVNAITRLKYRVMRHLPGRRGKKYSRKYGFAAAVRRSRGMTCIDLGANIGKITRMMASEARQVIAFEPDPWSLAALRINLADLENIRIESAAAGTSTETVVLYRHPGFEKNPAAHSQSSSVVAREGLLVAEGEFEVRQIDFIRYLEDLDEDIGILKIDIEGAEVALLEALFDRPDILERISYIFAETHERVYADHKPRVASLREKARQFKRPRVDLDWH